MHNSEFNMIRLFRIVWRHIIVIVLAAVICGAGGYVFRTFAVTDTYSSAVKLYVDTSSTDMSEYYQYTYATNAVESYIAMLNSTRFFTRVSEMTDPENTDRDITDVSTDEDGNEITAVLATVPAASKKYSPEKLAAMTLFVPIENTDVFRLVVTCPDRDDAQIIADACSLLADSSIKAIKSDTSVNIVDGASAPVIANGNHKLYAALFALVGLVVSITVFVFVDIHDVTIKTEDDIVNVYDFPLLGTVPDFDPEHQDKKNHKYYYKYTKGGSSK